LFVELRATFEKVNTEKIFESMRERERNKQMVGTED
jgi:hypothetical protein